MAANKPHQKVQRTSKKKYTLKKAITHIKLDPSNPNKLKKLDRLADEYMRVVQLFCDDLIVNDARTPDKNANLPDVQTELSARWQRTAWRQACGIVQSWFSNERTHPPVLTNISIQANPNVAELQNQQPAPLIIGSNWRPLTKAALSICPSSCTKKRLKPSRSIPACSMA